MKFNKIEFLEEIKNELTKAQIKDIELFGSKKNTRFPLILIDFGVIRNNVSTIDSTRKIKYIEVPIIIEIYTKDTREITKEKSCLEIEDKIISCFEESENLRNLTFISSMQLPNLDNNVNRWRITYNATINVENSGII